MAWAMVLRLEGAWNRRRTAGLERREEVSEGERMMGYKVWRMRTGHIL